MKLVELTEANSDALEALVLVGGPDALLKLHEYLLQGGGRLQRRCRLYGQALDSWPARGGYRYCIAFDDAKHDRSTLGYAIHATSCREALGQVLIAAEASGIGELGYCVILDTRQETRVVEAWFQTVARLIEQRGVGFAVANFDGERA